MIDTHCHLTFPQLHERLDAVLDGAREAGVDRMICVGTTPADADHARSLAETHDAVWFTAGVHPHYADRVEPDQLDELHNLAAHPRCAAVGEMGLDYHYDDPPPRRQHRLLEAQLEAIVDRGIGLPIVIHCRKAVDDTLAMLRGSGLPGERFVFHCFTEPPADARRVLDFGARISFTGIVTYKNAPEVRESADLVPDERIMVETDAPYLSPEPHRKVRPNEPKLVPATARYLAERRKQTFDDFVARCDANADHFYHLHG